MKQEYYLSLDNRLFQFVGNFKPKSEIPKSWHEIESVTLTALKNNYNSGSFTLYRSPSNCENEYMASTLRDGCFHKYCGKLVEVKKYIGYSNVQIKYNHHVMAHVVNSFYGR